MNKEYLDQMQSVAVLVCDDEVRTRQALKALLLTRELVRMDKFIPSIQVIDEACQVIDLSKMVEIYQPQVLIMDAPKTGNASLQVIREIKWKWPYLKIVMLSMNPDLGPTAVKAGVDKFLLKGCSAETLFEAILD